MKVIVKLQLVKPIPVDTTSVAFTDCSCRERRKRLFGLHGDDSRVGTISDMLRQLDDGIEALV
jgi:hypothetical protein